MRPKNKARTVFIDVASVLVAVGAVVLLCNQFFSASTSRIVPPQAQVINQKGSNVLVDPLPPAEANATTVSCWGYECLLFMLTL